MKLYLSALLGLALTFGAAAQDAGRTLPPDTTKVGDLTVGDLRALAEARALAFQQAQYVRRAEISSFLLPGLGQFEVGDPLGGVLNLAGQIALIGGTFYAAWALLPADLQSRDLSRRDRNGIVGHYWATDPGKVAPSALVVAGGLTLAVIHRFWASANAGDEAKANIASGKVTFKPDLGWGFFGLQACF